MSAKVINFQNVMIERGYVPRPLPPQSRMQRLMTLMLDMIRNEITANELDPDNFFVVYSTKLKETGERAWYYTAMDITEKELNEHLPKIYADMRTVKE